MRLIDADKALDTIKEMYQKVKASDWSLEDYEDLLVDCFEVFPTVEAIPVEWIEMWGRPHTMDYWSKDGYLSVEHDEYYTIDNMLKDWREENEQSDNRN